VRLVTAAARGDRRAFGALYDRHARAMLALGVRLFGATREAEDILHDVFVEVWRRAGEYDARRGSVRRWLLLRMRSRSLDRVRSFGRSRGQSLGDLEPARPGPEDGDALERAPDRGRVLEALPTLPDEQRAVVELGYFQGWSSAEMAAHLGVPIGTVKSRLRMAIARLRAALGVES